MSNATAPWIPTADRLPEEPGFYLTTVMILDPVVDDGKDHLIDISYFNTRHRWADFDPEDVIAWMPLPEPYST